MDIILVEIGGYQLSWLEACAVCTSFLCILFAIKEKIATFPFGILSTSLYFFVFYQFHLYSSMLLQLPFFGFNCYGYYKWTHPDNDKKKNGQLKVTVCTQRQRWLYGLLIAVGTLLWGTVSSKLNVWWPVLFSEPAQYAYADAFLLVVSLAAQYMVAIKKLENWILWLVVNVVATILYVATEAWFTAALYAVLIGSAIAGWVEWQKSYRTQGTEG